MVTTLGAREPESFTANGSSDLLPLEAEHLGSQDISLPLGQQKALAKGGAAREARNSIKVRENTIITSGKSERAKDVDF